MLKLISRKPVSDCPVDHVPSLSSRKGAQNSRITLQVCRLCSEPGFTSTKTNYIPTSSRSPLVPDPA